MHANDYCMERYQVSQNTSPREHVSCSRNHTNQPSLTRFDPAFVNAKVRGEVMTTIAGVRGGGNVKGRINAAAKLLGLPFDRIRQYYYDRVKRIEAHEALQILELARAAKRENFARMRNEYERLREELVEEAPFGLGWLVPPAVEPLLDPEDGSENREIED